MSNRILITGGTGFAGSHLVEYLLEQGEGDIHVTSSSGRTSFVHSLLPADHIHQLDLTQAEPTFELLKQVQPTQLYHLAAFSIVGGSFDVTEKIITHNTQLQINVLEGLKQFAPKCRILVVGSALEYDLLGFPAETVDEQHPLGPTNPYGVSKVNQDLLGLSYAYAYDLDVVRARPFNHTGERQTSDFAIPAFAEQIMAVKQGQTASIKVGNLEAIRDLSDVKDVVRAYALLMEQGQTRQVYNIGSGQGHSMQEVLDQMIKLSRVEVTVEVDPARFRPVDIPRVVANTSKIKELGWQPTYDLSQTLTRVLQTVNTVK